MLELMKPAPDFSLPNQKGEVRSLKDFRGQFVVVYFYPKDNTPGCTVQACSYRDRMGEFFQNKIKVFGISKDDQESHQKFELDQNLNFEILSDVDRQAIEAYGVWKEKNMYGKKVFGVERTTFVINPEGLVTAIFPKADPETDADKVLKTILG
jgi:thioredoxin-dependent peroxiredoxin